MKICFVYQGGEFPPAERIEKQAKSLISNGHEIFVFCNNYGDFKLSKESFNNININRLVPTLKNKKLNKILKFPIFFNPLWAYQLFLFCKKNKIDALQVIDIALAPLVWAVGRLLDMKIVLDMWENYPEALKGWGMVDWKTRLFKNYRIAKIVEKFSVKVFDKIFVVVDEQADRLIKNGIDKNKIIVISNTVDLEQFSLEKFKNLDSKTDKKEFILLYAGVINIERGLEDIIRAVSTFKKKNNYSIKLIIAGDGNYKKYLNDLVSELNICDLVDFTGWISFNKLPNLILESDLCLVPHINNEFINTTIPNKIFQYMALSKPVLVSNAEPLKRIINEGNAGYVFESGNSESAYDEILKAYTNKEERLQKGINGLSSVINKYNWLETEKDLINAYNNI